MVELIDSTSTEISEPMEMLSLSLNERVHVRLRHNRVLTGRLVAYDDHLNLMLGDTQETIKTEATTVVKDHSIIFVRGDLVVAVSPIN